MSDRFARALTEKKQLVDYLSSTYDCSEDRAREILEQKEHEEAIDYGIKVASFVYFVGDKIADDEGLEMTEMDDDDGMDNT
jgi:hypothetical protein